jgi:hypothetical protein
MTYRYALLHCTVHYNIEPKKGPLTEVENKEKASRSRKALKSSIYGFVTVSA